MKTLFALFFILTSLFATQIKPQHTYLASGGVTDLVLDNQSLYVATSASSVDIFNTQTQTLIHTIKIPLIKDFMGEPIKAKIYSVDVLNNKILIASQGEKGFRNIFIYEKERLTPIIDISQKMYVARTQFIDENRILIALLSNQLFLYDIVKKEFLWETQVSQSKFSHFVLTEDKSSVIIADESGSLKKINVHNGKLEKIYSGVNVDNVFQVDTKNGIIITAGQDRRCAIYNGLNQYYKSAEFLIYSAGLSPSGKLAGFANNEQNDITVFEVKSKNELYTLRGHQMTLTKILFKNENELFSSSDGNEVYYWQLKE